MRKFVIVEKHRPWLWVNDEVAYHDRDFMIVWAHQFPGSRDMELHGFILFDRNLFESYTETQINDIARLHHVNHHNGLPLCSNRRIFVPFLSQETINNDEEALEFLRKIRKDIIETVDRNTAARYSAMIDSIRNYTEELKKSGKDL